MQETAIGNPVTEVKEMLRTHIDWLTNLWGDLQIMQELSATYPEDTGLKETERFLWEAITQEQHFIVSIRRGNYEDL
jgi:hypothetical protein